MNPLNPLSALLKSMSLALSGRIHFLRQRVGETLVLEGETWTIFRQVVVDPTPDQPKIPGAIFRPRFHVKSMSVKANILFSWIPVGFFIGLPGFRSKLWLVNPESGDFAGYYEWDTIQHAEAYGRSFAARFMTRRSVPGSVSFKIMAQGG